MDGVFCVPRILVSWSIEILVYNMHTSVPFRRDKIFYMNKSNAKKYLLSENPYLWEQWHIRNKKIDKAYACFIHLQCDSYVHFAIVDFPL